MNPSKVLVYTFLVVTILIGASARSQETTSPNPYEIAARLAWEFAKETTTYKCVEMAAKYSLRNIEGNSRACNKVHMRVEHFKRNPNAYQLKQLMLKTGSKRTSHFAAKWMGCKAWNSALDAAGRPKDQRHYRRRPCS